MGAVTSKKAKNIKTVTTTTTAISAFKQTPSSSENTTRQVVGSNKNKYKVLSSYSRKEILPDIEETDEKDEQQKKQEKDIELDPSSAAWVKVTAIGKFQENKGLSKEVEPEPSEKFKSSTAGYSQTQTQTQHPVFSVAPRNQPENTGQRGFLEEADFDYEKYLPYTADLETYSKQMCVYCNTYQISAVLIECRICSEMYHKACLLKHGIGNDESSKTSLANSKTEIGWSCPNCEDLSSLLTQSEQLLIIGSFDDLDIDHNTTISLEEFKKFYMSQTYSTCSPAREKIIQHQFNEIDKDGNGAITWWEFMTNEAINIIKKRQKNVVLKQLYPKEIKRLRTIFKKFDRDSVGIISIDRTSDIINEWLQTLGLQPYEDHVSLFVKRNLINLNTARVITWESFLTDNCVLILCARPNKIGNVGHYLQSIAQ